MPLTSLTTPTQAGELKVFAATNNDFPGFKNTTNGTVRVNLNATGQWCLYNVPATDPDLVIFNSQTDWKGLPQLNSKFNIIGEKTTIEPNQSIQKYKFHWKAWGLTPGSLIAEIYSPQGSHLYMMGSPTFIDLTPGSSVEFYINDDARWYGDNSGEITLSYTCSSAAPIPPPIVKAHNAGLPSVVPEGWELTPKKIVSYAGIDYYPLSKRSKGFLSLVLHGIKEGRIVRSYEFVAVLNPMDITIDPATEVVEFNWNASPNLIVKMPWSVLSDTMPTKVIVCRVLNRVQIIRAT